MVAAPRLFVDEGRWHVTSRYDARVLALADRHYSRQTVGSEQFLPPGERLCMLTDDGLAVWGVVSNLDPVVSPRWRVTIFRREGGGTLVRPDPRGDGPHVRVLASALRQAAARAAHHGGRPAKDASQARSGPVLPPRGLGAHRGRARPRRAARSGAGGVT